MTIPESLGRHHAILGEAILRYLADAGAPEPGSAGESWLRRAREVYRDEEKRQKEARNSLDIIRPGG